jgi:hypothetical protein
MQGGHHVAQKFNNTTFPRKSANRTVFPEASISVKPGAVPIPSRWPAATVSATQAATQRSANTRVAGKASASAQAAANSPAARSQRRLCRFATAIARWARLSSVPTEAGFNVNAAANSS